MVEKICLTLQLNNLSKNITPNFVQAEFDKNVMHRRETHEQHVPYELETKMLQLVRNGDVEGFSMFFGTLSATGASVGHIGADAVAQGRNVLIATVTMFTRAAIDGGMDNELAYDLSDAYLTYASKITESEMLYGLVYTSGLDFTVRVRRSKISRSLPIKKCCIYISEHLHEKITLKQLAVFCSRTESYVSTSFKSQLRLSPMEYARNEKLKEACKMLLFGNLSVSGIAAQLGFCSHSNFTMHFKKIYGVVPLEYRNGAK